MIDDLLKKHQIQHGLENDQARIDAFKEELQELLSELIPDTSKSLYNPETNRLIQSQKRKLNQLFKGETDGE